MAATRFKTKEYIGGNAGVAFFSQAELQAAYQLAAIADKRSKSDGKDSKPVARPSTIRRKGNLN